MIFFIIGIIILGIGFLFSNLDFDKPKTKKLPIYIVVADDGEDE